MAAHGYLSMELGKFHALFLIFDLLGENKMELKKMACFQLQTFLPIGYLFMTSCDCTVGGSIENNTLTAVFFPIYLSYYYLEMKIITLYLEIRSSSYSIKIEDLSIPNPTMVVCFNLVQKIKNDFYGI